MQWRGSLEVARAGNTVRKKLAGNVRIYLPLAPSPERFDCRLGEQIAYKRGVCDSVLRFDSENESITMKTNLDNSILKRNLPLFWCALAIPAASIALGINFILNPVGASAGFGIPIHDPAAFPFMWIKGIRDIFSGVVVLTFLLRGDRRTTATLFAIATFIPICDGLVILKHFGFAPPIYIHWGTALYMMIVAAFLLKRNELR